MEQNAALNKNKCFTERERARERERAGETERSSQRTRESTRESAREIQGESNIDLSQREPERARDCRHCGDCGCLMFDVY